MMIKIGNDWVVFDGKPVMLLLTEEDKKQIGAMPEGADRYAKYDDDTFESSEDVHTWMDKDYEAAKAVLLKEGK